MKKSCQQLLVVWSCAWCFTAHAAESAGPAIVAQYKAVFTEPPARIPSNNSTDAPLLGNGDLLAALGGRPEQARFYINKNDLWFISDKSGSKPAPLARLDLDLPDLKDASYRVEQDLSRGLTIGTFARNGATLTMESAVAATENLLWVKLSASGGNFAGNARLVSPGEADMARPLSGGGGRIQLGREQHGNGRWYFDGAMDEIVIHDRALSPKEIQVLAAGRPLRDGIARSWDFEQTGTVPGVKGKAMAFDGKTTFVDSEPLKPGKTITVSGFVKAARHTGGGNAQYILSQGEWNKDWSLGLPDGKLRLAVSGSYVESPAAIPLDRWVHVAGSFDGRSLRVFVDGKDVSPQAPSPPGVQVVERRFDKGVSFATGAACAMRVVTGDQGGDGAFTVGPGREVLLVVTANSLREAGDFRATAMKRALAFKSDDLSKLKSAHDGWWRSFWNRSFVEIPDKKLEQRYYLSHYAMASASRLAGFPPDLYGWYSTENPKWGGGYFLNYNFYAQFYGLYAANHIEQADPCSNALIDAMETAKRYCEGPEAGIKGGLLLPVSIGPKGGVSAPMTWHQKSHASYGCVPIASRWHATYDRDFARKVYPYVQGVAYFWENWLKLEEGPNGPRYVDRDDAVLEVHTTDSNPCGQANPLQTLALIRQVMNLAIDMSTELGVDAARRSIWADIRDRLSDYPTCTVRDLPPGSRIDELRTEEVLNLPIFRYSEIGPAWQNDNAVGIQHIFPGNGIGLDSKPDLLARARNQVRVLNRWVDLNGCNSFYPAAARVGYDPAVILGKLSHWVATSSPNGMRADNPHGMEQFSVVPCTIQEMLFQSYDGTLRFFPCWPKDHDARFGTLRARGAFLVSAELKNGVISGVKITSEKGRDCVIANPWPGKNIRVICKGKPAEILTGDRSILKTSPGEVLELIPN